MSQLLALEHFYAKVLACDVLAYALGYYRLVEQRAPVLAHPLHSLIIPADALLLMPVVRSCDIYCCHLPLWHHHLSPCSTDPAASEARRGFVAKISDFGLSRPMGGNSKMLTKTYGTITHMSPELLEHGISSKAVDVYSFGVLLWQMLASSRAWAGLSHHAVVHSVCIKKLQLQFPPEAPEALVQLGQACMSYQSEDRPTFKDILEVLLPLRQFVSQQLEAA